MPGLMRLPPELLRHILEHLADAVELKQLLRLRRVSVAFDNHIMSGTVFPRSTSYRDIVNCDSEELILKYLAWYQNPSHIQEPVPIEYDLDEGTEVYQAMEVLRTLITALVEVIKGRYAYKTIQKIVHSLFARQLIVQRLQYHGEGPHAWAQPSHSFRRVFLYWVPESCEELAASRSTAPGQAAVIIACALNDRALLSESLKVASEEYAALYGSDASAIAIINNDHILGRPIQAAIWSGHHSLVDHLMQSGCQLIYSGFLTALKDAVCSHQHEILRQLLQHQPQPHYWNQPLPWCQETDNNFGDAIALACRHNDQVAFSMLQAYMPQPLKEEVLQFMLFSACNGGASELAIRILDSYPAMDVRFVWEWSACNFRLSKSSSMRFCLTEAAGHGDAELVRILLRRGAELDPDNQCRRIRFKAIDNACRFGRAANVQVLIQAAEQSSTWYINDAVYFSKYGPNPECLRLVSAYEDRTVVPWRRS